MIGPFIFGVNSAAHVAREDDDACLNCFTTTTSKMVSSMLSDMLAICAKQMHESHLQ